MKQSEKILVYGALLLSFLIMFFMIVSSVSAYVGNSNITVTPTVDDNRTDPNQTIAWTIGPIVNGTGFNVGTDNASISLGGIADFVNFGNDASLNPSTRVSLEAWFYPVSSTDDVILTKIHNNPNRQYEITKDALNRVNFQVNTTNGPVVSGLYLLPSLNRWYHIVGIYNTTHLRLFVNAVEVVAPVAQIGTMSDTGFNVYVGLRTGGFGPFNGTIDEARIYNRSLSTVEVSEHYVGVYQNETGLVLHADFDGDYFDTSGEGNNGAPGGAPGFVDGWAYVPVLNNISGQAALVNSTTGLMSMIQDAPATAANYTNVNFYPESNIIQNGTYALFQVDLYNVSVFALYTEVEAGFQTLIYANGSSILDGHELTDGDTLIVNGITLIWNSYMEQFEATTTSAIPTTVTYDTLTSLIETTYTITNGQIILSPTVTWVTPKLDLLLPFMRDGDWPGVVIEINVLLMGATMFWTFLLMSISVGTYNYVGAEATLLVWMLGWGTFNTVIHGQAQTIALIMMAVGGGIYIAKFFLDRRTTV